MRFPLISILLLATALPALAHDHGRGYERREECRSRPMFLEAGPRIHKEWRPLARPWGRERCEQRYEGRYDERRDECRRERWRDRDEAIVMHAPPVVILPPVPRLHVWLGF